jgi:hypothetical protein
MNAKCIKSSKRLVKNAIYKVAYLSNQNTKGHSFFRPTIRIYLNDNSIQTFPLESFLTESDTQFPNVNWMDPYYQTLLNEREQTKIDKTLKVGDYVVPKFDHLKTLVMGKKYKVKEVFFKDHKSTSGHVTWTDIKIKLDGSERWYTDWNFRKCTSQEVRDIGLKSLFDENTGTETVGRYKRKFDYLSDDEKVKILIRFLIESANDRYRNKMDIIDWAIQKTGEKYSLNRQDFDYVKDLSFISVLDIIK